MQSKSAALRDQINEWDAKIQAASNLAERNQLEAERNELNNQLQAVLAEEANQQAQAEQIGGLKEIMQSIFEAAFPKDETVKLIGLTEYETTQETYNQLVDQAVDENQSSLYAAFQQLTDQKDERYRLLTLQSLEVERQLEIEKQINNDLNIKNQELIGQIADMDSQINLNADYIKAQDAEIQRLKDREFDLQQQIANVQVVPQTIDFIPVAASESLSDRIAKAKVNSKLQLANVKAIGANWVEGINSEGNVEVAHRNDVEPVTEFPNIEPVNPVMETVEAAEIQPFPESNQVDATNTQGDTSLEGDKPVHESVGPNEESEVVTRAEFAELKKRVWDLENGFTQQAVA